MKQHIGKAYDKVDSKGILTGKPSYTGDFVPKDDDETEGSPSP